MGTPEDRLERAVKGLTRARTVAEEAGATVQREGAAAPSQASERIEPLPLEERRG